ncbi:MAG: hypothetical protein SFU91_02385 [Chloroherpetonaceae bacterium]|nr:hypothetical protein [Chloroherpetonaceae bacterium]
MKKILINLSIGIILLSNSLVGKTADPRVTLEKPKGNPQVVVHFYQVRVLIQPPNLEGIVFQRELNDPNFEAMISTISSRLESVHKVLHRVADSLRLSEWWRFQLYLQAAKSIEVNDERVSHVLLALLEKTPFNATLVQESTNQKNIRSLALAIKEKLFFASNLEYMNSYFYLIDIKSGKFHTLSSTQVEMLPISQEKMNRKRPMDLRVTDMPDFGGATIKKEWIWRSGGKLYALKGEISQLKMAFYAAYPQRDLPTYFDMIFGESLFSLADSLASIIQKEKKSSIEALQFLHDFVTYALPYKEDKATERGEHCSFAEETLFDEYSDCEDRTILLALLYKKILKIRPIILEYKDHVSLAIPISKADLEQFTIAKEKNNKMTLLKFESKDYLPIDPSFFNSTIGEINPLFSKRKTERIFFVP